MTSTVPTTAADQARRTLRLRLKPKARAIGHVDGAWWPHSRELSRELPALIEVLSVRLGAVTRVAYAMAAWPETPRRIEVAGQPVRLEGFRTQDNNIVHVSGPDRQRVSLLVVPPGASEAAGHDAMMTAATRGNTDSPERLLASCGTGHAIPTPRSTMDDTGPSTQDDAEARWEFEGGHLRGREPVAARRQR
ncbi:hypothetical protein F0L68_27690 [Solihabitans fulvus]|uniref:Uncharacterized protein n=1 Tax=Solihabitans fulvus TaxID=1892852 RepID=A0A5B2WYH0_9PSEU|nr:DUF5994 family protein [Solihabitans fulvus]KAA2255970.1 hypothetical protein F0L68_27690 [Solihabitans fulvus]